MSRYEGAALVGLDGLELGVVRPVSEALNSICDNLLDGGAAFGPNSIFNDFSQYGGAFGANSPFNPESAAPPQIVLDGQVLGILTVSPFIDDAVNPHELLAWLGCPAS